MKPFSHHTNIPKTSASSRHQDGGESSRHGQQTYLHIQPVSDETSLRSEMAQNFPIPSGSGARVPRSEDGRMTFPAGRRVEYQNGDRIGYVNPRDLAVLNSIPIRHQPATPISYPPFNLMGRPTVDLTREVPDPTWQQAQHAVNPMGFQERYGLQQGQLQPFHQGQPYAVSETSPSWFDQAVPNVSDQLAPQTFDQLAPQDFDQRGQPVFNQTEPNTTFQYSGNYPMDGASGSFTLPESGDQQGYDQLPPAGESFSTDKVILTYPISQPSEYPQPPHHAVQEFLQDAHTPLPLQGVRQASPGTWPENIGPQTNDQYFQDQPAESDPFWDNADGSLTGSGQLGDMMCSEGGNRSVRGSEGSLHTNGPVASRGPGGSSRSYQGPQYGSVDPTAAPHASGPLLDASSQAFHHGSQSSGNPAFNQASYDGQPQLSRGSTGHEEAHASAGKNKCTRQKKADPSTRKRKRPVEDEDRMFGDDGTSDADDDAEQAGKCKHWNIEGYPARGETSHATLLKLANSDPERFIQDFPNDICHEYAWIMAFTTYGKRSEFLDVLKEKHPVEPFTEGITFDNRFGKMLKRAGKYFGPISGYNWSTGLYTPDDGVWIDPQTWRDDGRPKPRGFPEENPKKKKSKANDTKTGTSGDSEGNAKRRKKEMTGGASSTSVRPTDAQSSCTGSSRLFASHSTSFSQDPGVSPSDVTSHEKENNLVSPPLLEDHHPDFVAENSTGEATPPGTNISRHQQSPSTHQETPSQSGIQITQPHPPLIMVSGIDPEQADEANLDQAAAAALEQYVEPRVTKAPRQVPPSRSHPPKQIESSSQATPATQHAQAQPVVTETEKGFITYHINKSSVVKRGVQIYLKQNVPGFKDATGVVKINLGEFPNHVLLWLLQYVHMALLLEILKAPEDAQGDPLNILPLGPFDAAPLDSSQLNDTQPPSNEVRANTLRRMLRKHEGVQTLSFDGLITIFRQFVNQNECMKEFISHENGHWYVERHYKRWPRQYTQMWFCYMQFVKMIQGHPEFANSIGNYPRFMFLNNVEVWHMSRQEWDDAVARERQRMTAQGL